MVFTDINSWIIRSEVQTLTRVCNESSSFHVPLTSMRWTSPVIHEHCSTLGHSITHDKVEVILPEDNTLKRKIKEVVEDGPCLVPDGGLELKTMVQFSCHVTILRSSDYNVTLHSLRLMKARRFGWIMSTRRKYFIPLSLKIILIDKRV